MPNNIKLKMSFLINLKIIMVKKIYADKNIIFFYLIEEVEMLKNN